MQDLFFELIQVALSKRDIISRIPSVEEWRSMYNESQKQALTGICFAGLGRYLSNLLDPDGKSEFDETWLRMINLPEDLYYDWMGMAVQIQQRNEFVNDKCAKLQRELQKVGFSGCILKGQGVGKLYGEELSFFRQSGDIDVWLFDAPSKIKGYVTSTGRAGHWDYSHIVYNRFKEVAVEVHYRPSSVPNLLKNRRLQNFYSEYAETCKVESVELGSGRINVPTLAFNKVFILLHIYKHLIGEGIGLRQLMDYYYVLRASDEKDNAEKVIRSLRLERFASAVMWIQKQVFGLEDKYLLFEPNEKEGRFLLGEVMKSGNFGHHDERIKRVGNSSMVRSVSAQLQHNFMLVSHYPSEFFWTPIWIVWHWCWKRFSSIDKH